MKEIKIGIGTFTGSAVFSALMPFSCCWSPALLVGISGGATWFSWVHPFRPYFFAIAFLSLGFSFYKAYKPQKVQKEGCQNCVNATKPGFFKSKLYVWLVTLFVVIMLTIP